MIIESYIPYMQLAYENALDAFEHGEIPVGAIVVYQNNVVASARNRMKESQLPTMHAEILALEDAAKEIGIYNMQDSILFTTLEPCGMCSGAIANFQISTVVFGAYDQQFGCMYSKMDLPRQMGKSIKCIGGVMEKECKELLYRFFETLRNV